jgi:hypothetical protein
MRQSNAPARQLMRLVSVCIFIQLAVSVSSAQNFRAFEDFGWGFGISLSVPAIVDIDGNGRPDLFVGTSVGYTMHYERQAGTGIYLRKTLKFVDPATEPETAPVFADLDGDGLLEMLVGGNGGVIALYKQSAPTSATFTLVTAKLGDIDAGAWSRPFVVDLDGNGMLDLLIGISAKGVRRYEQQAPNSFEFVERRPLVLDGPGGNGTHACLHDLDGDGRLELILGTLAGALQLYRQHNAVADSFLLIDDAWCGIESMSRGAPCIADLDGDGLLDMLLGSSEGPIMHFEQPAPGALDGWELRSNNALGTWDFGTNCTGLVTDLDHDGRLDILRTQASEKYSDRDFPILRFRQLAVGDLRMEAAGSLEGVTAGYFDKLAIADFDNDGRLDLLVARSSSQGIEYYRQSESNSAAFDLVTAAFIADIPGTWTSLVPVFFDLDKNGKLDLLLANANKSVHRYEQVQAGSAEFVKVKEDFMQSMPFHVAPAFTDLDGDGDLDMLVGTMPGEIEHYKIQSVDPLRFILITSPFQNIKVGTKSVPGIIDMNNDGRLDIVIADGDGGMSLYLDMGPTSVGSPVTAPVGCRLLSISPNPAAANAIVRLEASHPVAYTLSVYDALGRQVLRITEAYAASPGVYDIPVGLSGLTSGMYHVHLEANGVRSSQPLMLLR